MKYSVLPDLTGKVRLRSGLLHLLRPDLLLYRLQRNPQLTDLLRILTAAHPDLLLPYSYLMFLHRLPVILHRLLRLLIYLFLHNLQLTDLHPF